MAAISCEDGGSPAPVSLVGVSWDCMAPVPVAEVVALEANVVLMLRLLVAKDEDDEVDGNEDDADAAAGLVSGVGEGEAVS